MRSDFVTSHLADMAPALGDAYQRWLPTFRAAIRDTLASLTEDGQLEAMLEMQLDPAELELLRAGWQAPFQSYLERSGKMLRPFLVCLCAEAWGREPRPRLVAAAEFIHSASLILDDISDDSRFRRGGPTAHQRVGVGIAGACASSWLNLATHLFWEERSVLGEDATMDLVREACWEHWVTGIGTTVDVTWAWKRYDDLRPAAYLQQVVHRSTSYTYRLPLKIGGYAAGASRKDIARLVAYGERLGLAFQLVDDILNVNPDDSHWGKEVAEDIAQGKFSLQVIHALEVLPEGNRQRLLEILGRTRDPELLAEAAALLAKSGAFEACRRQAEGLANEAIEALDALDAPPQFREQLRAFAAYVLRRAR
jgi:geranylgeranyl diphosphate synthase, type I